jgi:hypothetical protein
MERGAERPSGNQLFKIKYMGDTVIQNAIIGGLIGFITVIVIYAMKNNKFKAIRKSITDDGVDYAAFYHYASYNRYQKKLKFFDSSGVLYVIGKTAYFKTGTDATPVSFNLPDCTIQSEPDWRRMKWFSITTAVGEKHYFNSHKVGAFTANSAETLNGLQFLQARQKA